MENLFEKYVLNGGPMMALLLPLSLIMLGGILQMAIHLRRSRVLPEGLLKQARQVRQPTHRSRFLASLEHHSNPLARLVRLTASDAGTPMEPLTRQQVDLALTNHLDKEVDRMYGGLGLLETIYTIAPLMGLLGTILGMMHTFYQFGVRQEKSVEILSVGIQEALVTTLWGLSIAIPAFVAVQWFRSVIRRYEREKLPEAVWGIVSAMDAAHRRTDTAPAPARPRRPHAQQQGMDTGT